MDDHVRLGLRHGTCDGVRVERIRDSRLGAELAQELRLRSLGSCPVTSAALDQLPVACLERSGCTCYEAFIFGSLLVVYPFDETGRKRVTAVCSGIS